MQTMALTAAMDTGPAASLPREHLPTWPEGSMCGSLFPPARNTPSTGKPANVLQQVSNLASLASVARGGYVLPTTLRSLFFFHVSSMSPCIATISNSKCLASLVVPAAHGVLAQPTQKYSVQAFQPTVRMRDSDPRLPRHLLPVAVFPPGCDPSQTHAY